MTDYTTIYMSIAGFLAVVVGLSGWLLRTVREFMFDLHELVQAYKEAKADKKLTSAEKDIILTKLETLLNNIGKNARRLIIPNDISK